MSPHKSIGYNVVLISACGDFCTICDQSGAGKCDPDGCSPKYAFNDTTKTCQRKSLNKLCSERIFT